MSVPHRIKLDNDLLKGITSDLVYDLDLLVHFVKTFSANTTTTVPQLYLQSLASQRWRPLFARLSSRIPQIPAVNSHLTSKFPVDIDYPLFNGLKLDVFNSEADYKEDVDGWVALIAVALEGRLLTSNGFHTLRLWDLVQHREVWMLEDESACVTALGVSSDGMRVVCSWDDNTLRVYDIPGEAPRWVSSVARELGLEPLWKSPFIDGCVSSVRFAGNDDEAVVAMCGDGRVRAWDAFSGCILPHPLSLPEKEVDIASNESYFPSDSDEEDEVSDEGSSRPLFRRFSSPSFRDAEIVLNPVFNHPATHPEFGLWFDLSAVTFMPMADVGLKLPLPPSYLAAPATFPPVSELHIYCDASKVPTIHAMALATLTVADVLEAIHGVMQSKIFMPSLTHFEQLEVMQQYGRRYRTYPMLKGTLPRVVDYLGREHVLQGLDVVDGKVRMSLCNRKGQEHLKEPALHYID